MTATDIAQVVHLGPRCILVLSGEIDVAAAPGLTSFARDALVDTAVTDVVIDTSAVTFIDSTGVSALLAIRDTAMAQGAAVRICGVSDNVAKVLTIMGLNSMFDLSA
ncbi:MAG TPA: STAS domain-containing protein [Mycobacterium sp.]|nr:STAS domain-containing protein [Mycobacterium sp.]